MHPLSFIKFILTPNKIKYILELFGPLCFLPLLSPLHFLLILPPLFKNLIGSGIGNLVPYIGINEHYVAGLIPFLFIATIYGCNNLLQKYKNAGVIIGIVLLFSALLSSGKTDGYRIAEFLKDIKENKTLEKIKFLNQIPPMASVSASGDLCPHLAHRKLLYIWHPVWGTGQLTRYIVIDRINLEKSSHSNPYSINEALNLDGYLKNASIYGYKTILNRENGNFLILYNGKIP